MPSPEAASVRALAALIRSGSTVRRALGAWPEELPEPQRDPVLRVRARLALGSDVAHALGALPRDLADLLAPVLTLHLAAGGDAAAALDRIADAIEDDADFVHAARAASAGARLSGRLVAGLPLAFVAFSPTTRAALTDPFGLAMLLVGAMLSVVGLRWIGRLVPAPPPADPVLHLCSGLAGLLRAGLSPHEALVTLAAHPPAGLERWLAAAARRVRLGRSWPGALQGCPGGLEAVGRVVERAQRAGVPVAASLEQLSARLREERRLAFETRMKRAPVLMVVPLTCCILPAYGLLAVGPFLRSVTFN